MKESYRYFHKIGPGGLKCPCCQPIPGSLKKNKQYLNRLTRRKVKQSLAK